MTHSLEEFKANIAKHAAILRKHHLLDEHGVTGYWMRPGTKVRDYRRKERIIQLPDLENENV